MHRFHDQYQRSARQKDSPSPPSPCAYFGIFLWWPRRRTVCFWITTETRVWGSFNSVSCPNVSQLQEHLSFLFAGPLRKLWGWGSGTDSFSHVLASLYLSPSCLPSSLLSLFSICFFLIPYLSSFFLFFPFIYLLLDFYSLCWISKIGFKPRFSLVPMHILNFKKFFPHLSMKMWEINLQ